jgi:hypothetical protein
VFAEEKFKKSALAWQQKCRAECIAGISAHCFVRDWRNENKLAVIISGMRLIKPKIPDLTSKSHFPGQTSPFFGLKKPLSGQGNRKISASKSHFSGQSFGGASRGLLRQVSAVSIISSGKAWALP